MQSPAYYYRGGVDTADVIDAYDLNYWRGSAVAHILRAGHKPQETEEDAIANAIGCLEREMERLRNER